MIKLAISGACGKMGSRIVHLASQDEDVKVTIGLEKKGHTQIGHVVNRVTVTEDPQAIKEADVLIEFTAPQATIEHLETAIRFKKAVVIGTTGLTEEQKERIREASRKIPVVLAPNMSVGVNVLFGLVQEAAKKLSEDYRITIVEAHHVHKKDAPSGTAKRLAEIIETSSDRKVNDIKSIREDEIVGDHEVAFDSSFDTIKLMHSAKTRDIFAQGALKAAKWVVGKKTGLYTMQDVLKD